MHWAKHGIKMTFICVFLLFLTWLLENVKNFEITRAAVISVPNRAGLYLVWGVPECVQLSKLTEPNVQEKCVLLCVDLSSIKK